jgi:hypothetical protein
VGRKDMGGGATEEEERRPPRRKKTQEEEEEGVLRLNLMENGHEMGESTSTSGDITVLFEGRCHHHRALFLSYLWNVAVI